MERVTIESVDLVLSHPDEFRAEWVGQQELMDQVLACWLTVHADDLPLCPRLIGKPGVGKTTLAVAAARRVKKPVYIYQCTMDTRPEDLIVTPVISSGGQIAYHASPLVSAVITGGVAVLDEANRMSEKSWASLAPLLDNRRYVESIVAGVKIAAHPGFRCCVTMNDDASTYEVPDYIMSRIQPAVLVEFPPREEELAILKYNVGFAPEEALKLTVDFLQAAHGANLSYTTRDGVNVIRYSVKLARQRAGLSVAAAFDLAVRQVLGEEGADFKKSGKIPGRARRADGAGAEFRKNLVDFEDFFMNELFRGPADEEEERDGAAGAKPRSEAAAPDDDEEEEDDDEEDNGEEEATP
ncbi:MAG: AAA family ATPase [Planctomycetes bacterium]|nr:AAA family ATPase [Planctomycetota bacterium]